MMLINITQPPKYLMSIKQWMAVKFFLKKTTRNIERTWNIKSERPNTQVTPHLDENQANTFCNVFNSSSCPFMDSASLTERFCSISSFLDNSLRIFSWRLLTFLYKQKSHNKLGFHISMHSNKFFIISAFTYITDKCTYTHINMCM